MNYFDLYSSYPDRTIAAAWDSQVKESDNTPWLAGTLTECGDELFARFAACYAELSALPRSARRALQRQLARSSELAAILPENLRHGGRRLQHTMAWSLAGAALLLALAQGVATAATITVTTNDPNIISDGQCSLIEAIVNANNDAATHADCPPGSGADTIVLPANANLSLGAVDNNAFGPTGLPLITSPITIKGNGATIVRQGNAPAFRLMALTNSGDLTLQRVILSGGSSSRGGGVSNYGTLTIANSTISGNTGGGVSNSYGTLTIENSTISGNTTNSNGGGIYNYAGSSGSVTIENSTISGNAASFGGGGIYNVSGRVTITNSTISGNSANTGGGVRNSFYFYSGILVLNNSLIAGNQAVIAPEIENFASRGGSIVTANNFNLFGTDGNPGVSDFSPGPTDIVPGVSLAQILGPLQNNGGPTPTHALVAGSPAIDAGNPGGCRKNSGALLKKDQRGLARNVDGNNDGTARCDIGAVEFGAGSATATLMDFDGDGITDIGVYRNGMWFVLRSSDGGVTALGWGGLAQDEPVPGDYDGDGKTDIAVYRSGAWFILRSSDGGVTALGWGGLAQDEPVPGDYDGDGKTDIAVYRSGAWFILRSSDGGVTATGWGGMAQDVPVPADYDGDGKADLAVYRNGGWFILRSSDSVPIAVGWGAGGDVAMPADYDGDGRADLAVYRNGGWFILRSWDSVPIAVGWGAAGDVAVPADYDGDGSTDLAVFRDGGWFILNSSGGTQTVGWGAAGDLPLN